jgi:hypothetical protein
MTQYTEAGLPQEPNIEMSSAETHIALGQALSRSVDTSIAALDAFIGGFPSSQVTLIDSSDRLLFDMVHLLCINQVVGDGREVVWVDGGNSINPYHMAGLCKRQRVNAQEALESINVSRAFTAYQMVTLIDEMLEPELERTGAGMLIVSCFPDLFQDKDMRWSESLQLMQRCIAAIQGVTKRHDVVTLVTNFGLSKLLFKKSLRSLMYSSADRVLRIENASRAALRLSLMNEGRSMMYHPVPYYQRTLDEFLRSKK